jgi:hypothetical protein
MRRRSMLLVLIAALLSGRPAAAQKQGSPEAFALQYMAATQAGDWATVASYMHPEALTQFKSMYGELAAMVPTGQIYTNLFGVADSAAFAAAEPQTLFTSFMKIVAVAMPGLADAMAGSSNEIIGPVDEKKAGITHLVYRMKFDVDGLSMTKVEVMPLKKYDGAWRAMLTGDIEGMAAGMKQQLQQSR